MKKAPIEQLDPRPKIKQYELNHFSFKKHALHFDHSKDKARQEFKNDCDLGTILRKYTQTGQLPTSHRRGNNHGTVDYDINLQAGLTAMDAARRAWNNIPLDLRRAYPSWDKLESAIQRKKVIVKDGRVQFAPEPKTPVAPAEPAATTTEPPKEAAKGPSGPKD